MSIGDGADGGALARVEGTCRLCGFSARGFRCGSVCVLQVDWSALRTACHGGACRDTAPACAGFQGLVRKLNASGRSGTTS